MVLHNRHTRYMGAGGQEPVSKALLLKIEKYKKNIYIERKVSNYMKPNFIYNTGIEIFIL